MPGCWNRVTAKTEARRLGHDMGLWVEVGRSLDREFDIVLLFALKCKRPGCTAELLLDNNRHLYKASAVRAICTGEGAPEGGDIDFRRKIVRGSIRSTPFTIDDTADIATKGANLGVKQKRPDKIGYNSHEDRRRARERREVARQYALDHKEEIEAAEEAKRQADALAHAAEVSQAMALLRKAQGLPPAAPPTTPTVPSSMPQGTVSQANNPETPPRAEPNDGLDPTPKGP